MFRDFKGNEKGKHRSSELRNKENSKKLGSLRVDDGGQSANILGAAAGIRETAGRVVKGNENGNSQDMLRVV